MFYFLFLYNFLLKTQSDRRTLGGGCPAGGVPEGVCQDFVLDFCQHPAKAGVFSLFGPCAKRIEKAYRN